MRTGPLTAAIAAAAMLAGGAALAAEPARVAIHVDQSDAPTINMALNNAKNIIDHYERQGREVMVEIVTYGPGLHMLRADSSPVKDRISMMALEHENLAFTACLNTVEQMRQREATEIALVSEATVTPSGAVRLMELQEQGWSYLRP